MDLNALLLPNDYGRCGGPPNHCGRGAGRDGHMTSRRADNGRGAGSADDWTIRGGRLNGGSRSRLRRRSATGHGFGAQLLDQRGHVVVAGEERSEGKNGDAVEEWTTHSYNIDPSPGGDPQSLDTA